MAVGCLSFTADPWEFYSWPSTLQFVTNSNWFERIRVSCIPSSTAALMQNCSFMAVNARSRTPGADRDRRAGTKVTPPESAEAAHACPNRKKVSCRRGARPALLRPDIWQRRSRRPRLSSAPCSSPHRRPPFARCCLWHLLLLGPLRLGLMLLVPLLLLLLLCPLRLGLMLLVPLLLLLPLPLMRGSRRTALGRRCWHSRWRWPRHCALRPLAAIAAPAPACKLVEQVPAAGRERQGHRTAHLGVEVVSCYPRGAAGGTSRP